MRTGLRRVPVVLTLVLTTILAGACSNEDTVVDPRSQGNVALRHAPLSSLGEDQPFVEIATEVPTFGGFWYNKANQNQIVVAVTDLKDFSRVVALIPKYIGAHQPTAGYVAMKVGRSFADLARFRASLRSHVFARSGVVSLGVKESANRVEIGISTLSAEAEVRGVARALQIPDEAVVVVNVPVPRDASHTLQQQHPSAAIEGGWAIGHTATNPGEECTLGFPAIRTSNGSNVFVTNSHCTPTDHGFDGVTIKQPYGGSAIGTEILDPAAWVCLSFISHCRHSDAALILASRPLQFGRIARTTERTGFDITGGALTINHTNPTLTITGRNNHVYENEILDKVGRTTGWTYGAVEDTCTDYDFNGWVKLCSDRVDFAVQGGDSGSPVFYWNPDGSAELRGIVFGYEGFFYNDALMSDLHQIELDLGTLSVHAVIGNISGPTIVPANFNQMWTASVSGGKAPFTYAWYRDGSFVSSSSSYTGNTGWSSFELQLNVSDALGGSSMRSIEVQVSSCPPPEISC
jgi:hypothetical protein